VAVVPAAPCGGRRHRRRRRVLTGTLWWGWQRTTSPRSSFPSYSRYGGLCPADTNSPDVVLFMSYFGSGVGTLLYDANVQVRDNIHTETTQRQQHRDNARSTHARTRTQQHTAHTHTTDTHTDTQTHTDKHHTQPKELHSRQHKRERTGIVNEPNERMPIVTTLRGTVGQVELFSATQQRRSLLDEDTDDHRQMAQNFRYATTAEVLHNIMGGSWPQTHETLCSRRTFFNK